VGIWLAGSAGLAFGGIVADQVVSYTPGAVQSTYWGDPYTNSSAALGLPETHQGVPDIFSGSNQIAFADDSIITPFNASYNNTHVVALAGSGGSLELHLSSPIAIGPGAALGVHSAAGLNELDFNNPVGQNKTPAENYTFPRSADVQVSADGTPNSWIDLGDRDFNNPTNTFLDNSAYGFTSATQPVDYFKPFFGSLSSFDGKDWSDTLAVLNGSAGGTWLDLSGVPLSSVNYVSISTSPGELMYVDSVVGVSVPEPAAVGMLAAGAGLLLVRRVRHRA
jgi:hypothetical protein